MSEEIKPEIIKLAMPFADCVKRMSWKNLQGEANRLSRSKTESPLAGAIADILLVSFFKHNNRGNNPYCLELNQRDKKAPRGFEIK